MNETSVVTEFRWIEAGDGLPVLCLHGLFGASDHWERLVEAISPRCRAMALTLPIFETPPDDLSVTGLRAYVEAFMDAERVPPAIVVGNSLGGHVALDLALHAPERVRGPRALRIVRALRAELHARRAAPPLGGLRAREDDGGLPRPRHGHRRVGGGDPGPRQPAKLRHAGAPGEPLGQALQPGGSARRDPVPHPPGLGHGGPGHAARRRDPFPRRHPVRHDPARARVRPRADAGAPRGLRARGRRVPRHVRAGGRRGAREPPGAAPAPARLARRPPSPPDGGASGATLSGSRRRRFGHGRRTRATPSGAGSTGSGRSGASPTTSAGCPSRPTWTCGPSSSGGSAASGTSSGRAAPPSIARRRERPPATSTSPSPARRSGCTAGAGSTRSSSRSVESGGRRRSTGPCCSSAAAPGPSRSAVTPRSATCPAWRRGACPPGSARRYTPGPEIAAIPDWEQRLTATARRARYQDLRLVSGMPSWMLVLFERVRALADAPATAARASCGRTSRSSFTAGCGWIPTGASSTR